jgi:hypothetical protein
MLLRHFLFPYVSSFRSTPLCFAACCACDASQGIETAAGRTAAPVFAVSPVKKVLLDVVCML